MHIVIAPNSFKNSLDALSCAKAIEQGFLQSNLKCTCVCFPVGDGGDGTAKLLMQKSNATSIEINVHGPINRIINASFGFIENDKTAIIEMADASGIKLLKKDELNPLKATSIGTGELMKTALDCEAKKIILCIGGSATVDAGTGILKALGFKFLDEGKNELQLLPLNLTQLFFVDSTQVNKRIFETEIIILCDVENHLLGENGAAKIFGPQKGASKNDVEALESSLQQFQKITLHQTGIDMNAIKHGGAAGGVAAGLHAWLNAQLVDGTEYFLNTTNFNKALLNTDLIITGEGSIDAQTLQGKAPYGVAKRAKEKSISVIGLAGTIPIHPDEELNKFFDVLISINNETDLELSIANTKQNLTRTAKVIGDLFAMHENNFK